MEEQEALLKRISELEDEIRMLKGEDTEEEAILKEFFEKYPGAEAFADKLCAYIENSDEAIEAGTLGDALIKMLIAEYKAPEVIASDSDFLDKHIYTNEKIREKIINDYIDEVRKTPSACIKRTGLAQTQKEKPSTVRAAGELAKALFRK